MSEYIEREAIQKRLNRIVEVNNLRTDLAWFTPYGVKALIEEIPAADVRPVVVCANCEHNNRCLTQEFVDDCGKIPLDRNTFFCADGERRSNA